MIIAPRQLNRLESWDALSEVARVRAQIHKEWFPNRLSDWYFAQPTYILAALSCLSAATAAVMVRVSPPAVTVSLIAIAVFIAILIAGWLVAMGESVYNIVRSIARRRDISERIAPIIDQTVDRLSSSMYLRDDRRRLRNRIHFMSAPLIYGGPILGFLFVNKVVTVVQISTWLQHPDNVEAARETLKLMQSVLVRPDHAFDVRYIDAVLSSDDHTYALQITQRMWFIRARGRAVMRRDRGLPVLG